MSQIVELLREIRQRPAVYIGGLSIVKLAAFLRGFSYAVSKFAITEDDLFLREFQEWIADRFDVTISQSWENIIAFHSANDTEAMEHFWKLLDEYCAERNIGK